MPAPLPAGVKVGIGLVFDNRCSDGLRVSSLALDSPAFRTGSISKYFSNKQGVQWTCSISQEEGFNQ
jgi:hypothetical protein